MSGLLSRKDTWITQCIQFCWWLEVTLLQPTSVLLLFSILSSQKLKQPNNNIDLASLAKAVMS